jgi:hypothetical protein
MKISAVLKTGLTVIACIGILNSLSGQAAQRQRQDPLGFMGVQIGNEIDTTSTGCYIGTVGTMLTDGDHDYLLSNNHIMARSNLAALGEDIMHTVSTFCVGANAIHVGELTAYVPILTKRRAQNRVDAAIARVTPNVLVATNAGNVLHAKYQLDFGDAFPVHDNPIEPALYMGVQKSGRTTGYTTSSVSAVGVNVYVNYDSGRALFVDQFAVTGSGFSAGGDSGSLISDMNGNPVGLLYAGSSTQTIGNRISDVLDQLSTELGAQLRFGTSGDAGSFTWPESGGGGGDEGSGGEKPDKGNNGNGRTRGGLSIAGAAIEHAKAVRNRFESSLLDVAGIEGSGISFSEGQDRVVIQVYTSVPGASVRQFIPGQMDGIDVEIIETGVFEAY